MLTIGFVKEPDSDVWVTTNVLKLTGGRLILAPDDQALHGVGEWNYAGRCFGLVRVPGPVRLMGERGSLVRDLGLYRDLRLANWSVVDGVPVLLFDGNSYLWRYLPDMSTWDTVTFTEG